MKNAQAHCWLVLCWGYWDDPRNGTYETQGIQYTTKAEAKRAAQQMAHAKGRHTYVAKITNCFEMTVK